MKTKMEKFAILSLSWMLISTYPVSTALPAMKEYYIEYSGSQVEFLVSAAALGITFTILFNTMIAKYLKERLMVAGGLLLLSVSGIIPVFTDILSGDSWIPFSAWHRNWSGQCKGDQHDQ